MHQLTRHYKIPFSADHTESDLMCATYTCTFGGRCRSIMNQTSNTGCEAVLYFSKEIFDDIQMFTFEPMKSFLLTPNFVESHRNCLNQKQIEEIVYQTKVGVLSGRIRTNTQSSFVGSQIFYNIRRNVINEMKTENLQELIPILEDNNRYSTILHLHNAILSSLSVLHNEINSQSSATDNCIINDTCMTNIYGFPLEVIICVDQESHTQIISYGFLENKTTQSFIDFFQDFLILGGKEMRVIMVDRLKAQISAKSS